MVMVTEMTMALGISRSVDSEVAIDDQVEKTLDQVGGFLSLGLGESHVQHPVGGRADQESLGSASPCQPPRQATTLNYSGYPSSNWSEPIPSC
jgi:hypothetical protein